MPIKKLCECGAKVLPTVYDDVLSYEEQIGKLKITVAEILKDVENIKTTLPEELNNKLDKQVPRSQYETYAYTVEDVGTNITGIIPKQSIKIIQRGLPWARSIVERNEKGQIVANDGDSDNTVATCKQLNLKRNIVDPAPAGGLTRIYTVTPKTANGKGGVQTFISASPSAGTKNVVVIKNSKGQVELIKQVGENAIEPTKLEAITKEYADNNYANVKYVNDTKVSKYTSKIRPTNSGVYGVTSYGNTNKETLFTTDDVGSEIYFPPSVVYGNIPTRSASNVLYGESYDVDPDGDKHISDKAYANVEYVKEQLENKRDIVPIPAEGTRFYTANNAFGQWYAEGSTGANNKYDVVQRTDNAQIKAPNQALFPPLDDEYISRSYADANYGYDSMQENFVSTVIPKASAGVVVLKDAGGGHFNQTAVPIDQDEGSVVRRTWNGHIDLGDQISAAEHGEAPSDTQAIALGYADARYAKKADGVPVIEMTGFPVGATNGEVPNNIKTAIQTNANITILFEKEYYRCEDAGHQEGYNTYVHLGYENGTFNAKAITVNVNNWTWALNSGAITTA